MEDDAWQRLWDTLDRAFGGLPAEPTTQPVVPRGNPGHVLTGLARQPGDLLVIGAGRWGPLRLPAAPRHPALPGPRPLPILAIPPPALTQQASHGLRGWAWRYRPAPGHRTSRLSLDPPHKWVPPKGGRACHSRSP